jgi:hypothetical protein
MQGNPESDSSVKLTITPPQTPPSHTLHHKDHDAVEYAIRLTFGVVHASLLTLFSFGLAFLVPSFSHFLFSLFGCILAPLLSLVLSLFCNVCVEYVSKSTVTWKHILKWAWIPPLGVFGSSLLILPLEMMPSLGFKGPISTLVITSIIINFIVTSLLQVYAGKRIQTYSVSDSVSSASDSDGSSGPT